MPRLLHFTGTTGGRRVFLAVPSYGDPCAPFVFSLFASQVALQSAGISADFALLSGHCHVDDSRNELARAFLETDCERFVFIDADMGWDPVDLVKLVRYDRDVVAGIYPTKQDEEVYPVRPIPGRLQADGDGLIEVEGVPTGFVSISREVMQTLYDADTRSFFARRDDKTKALPIKILFERTFIDGNRKGGDYSFFDKVRAAGFKLWIDPEMRFEHVGDHSWYGGVGEYWRRINGLTIPLGIEAIQTGKATSRTYDDMVKAWGNWPWSAGSDLLEACAEISRSELGITVECGAGLTTLVMAAANPYRHIYALEHDREWCDRVTDEAKKLELRNVTVIYSPLKDGWYSEIPTVAASVLLVDGPPRWESSRELVFDRVHLSPGCVVVMDDAEDANYIQTVSEKTGIDFTVLDYGQKKFAVGKAANIRQVA